MSKIKLIIDTNLWVSYLINKQRGNLSQLLVDERFEIITSTQLSSEIAETLQYPHIKSWVPDNVRLSFLKAFSLAAILIEVNTDIRFCRDPNDDFLISLAVDGEAHYLITGDKDLLTLKQIENTRIVTIKEFIDVFYAE